MAIQIIPKSEQAIGQFNNGQIIENKPIGFPREGGKTRPYSNLFYWAYAEAKMDSTIGLHPHQGFEIMSFVLNGKIRHYDTQLKGWKELNQGDVQIIRAGNGISHAEFMAKDAVMFQIWLDPDINKTLQQPATYNDFTAAEFPTREAAGLKIITYSGTEAAPLKMDAVGVTIEKWSTAGGTHILETTSDKIYSIYVLSGEGTLNDQRIGQDDFIIARDMDQLKLEATAAVELFVIASPKQLDHPTYAESVQQSMR